MAKAKAHVQNIKRLALLRGISYMEAQKTYYSEEFKEEQAKMLASDYIPDCAECGKPIEDCTCRADEKPKKCPQCHGSMRLRKGPYGSFWGCVKYPDCKGIIGVESREKPKPESIEEIKVKMERTLTYVKEIGSTFEARKYIDAVISLLDGE